MRPFAYHRPASLDEAVRILASVPDGRLLAGGQTLIPAMKQRLNAPSDLIDIGRIAELRGISRHGRRLAIGAGMRHHEVAEDASVAAAIPALAALAGLIGDPQVRHMGTLGGSVALNDPAADYPAACLALDAEIRTTRRTHAAADFFQGFFATALESDEIVTAVSFRIPDAAAYEKHRSPASRYALVGVFVARLAGEVRVAVTGAGPGVFRFAAAEEALARRFAPEALEGASVAADGLNDDIHASAEYRAHLVRVMTARAVRRAASGSAP